MHSTTTKMAFTLKKIQCIIPLVGMFSRLAMCAKYFSNNNLLRQRGQTLDLSTMNEHTCEKKKRKEKKR